MRTTVRSPDSSHGFNIICNFPRFQEKRQKQKSRQSDSCLREISKLLAREGAVAGKGEVIQKGENSRKMVDIVTQGDAVTIEFEIDKAENGVITRPRDVSFTRYVLSCLIMSYICVIIIIMCHGNVFFISYGTTPAPKQLAAQLINKLEKHKKILEKERKSENNFQLA